MTGGVPGQGFQVMGVDGVAVVIPPAEIDLANAGALRDAIVSAGTGRATIVVDMTATEFCGSSPACPKRSPPHPPAACQFSDHDGPDRGWLTWPAARGVTGIGLALSAWETERLRLNGRVTCRSERTGVAVTDRLRPWLIAR